MLSESMSRVIKQEIDNANGDGMLRLVRRKGGQGKEVYAEDQRGDGQQQYDLLTKKSDKEELLNFWTNFHSHFDYPDFSTFYSKRKFCIFFSQANLDMEQTGIEDCFISLLADRQFLFLEDNEHGNNPEYPPMSEIVHNPRRYVAHGQASAEPYTGTIPDTRMRENAAVVLQQGIMPTYAHQQAYDELRHNEKDIRAALRLREELIRRSTLFLEGGIAQFPVFTISVSESGENPAPIDMELSQLFHDFVYAACYKAYVKKYRELLDDAQNNVQKNSLPVIMSVRKYLDENQTTLPCRALVFWMLFTKETTKLAKGKLGNFKFKMSEVKTGRRLTKQTQAPTYRKIDCQIMLFDYLLKLLPLKGADENREIAYAKFQFHAFSRYNGYTHFRVKSIKDLSCDPKSKCKYQFNLTPDSGDCVDHLGGVIRRHILCCISNDVRWLTPGLPNDWSTNSSTLATLLLQDTSRFPKVRRLTNRINSFLRSEGKECVEIYRDFRGGQSEWIDQLNQWCLDHDLIFEDDIPSSDIELSADKMKLLCSRLVLEYMIKEQALQTVRHCLSETAQRQWGYLLLKDYETFNLDNDS